jgi:hypothetical protein
MQQPGETLPGRGARQLSYPVDKAVIMRTPALRANVSHARLSHAAPRTASARAQSRALVGFKEGRGLLATLRRDGSGRVVGSAIRRAVGFTVSRLISMLEIYGAEQFLLDADGEELHRHSFTIVRNCTGYVSLQVPLSSGTVTVNLSP